MSHIKHTLTVAQFISPLSFFVFLFGLAFGSFLNSVIHRLYTSEQIFTERSYCPHCRHKLFWQDLIPLLSFIFLRGRCRYCQKQISLQYPLVELSTGIIFLLLFYSHTSISEGRFWLLGYRAIFFWFWHLFYWFFIASSLIVIFVYDLKHYIIPDKIIYPAIVIAFLNRLLESASPNYWTQFGVNSFEFGTLKLEFGIWDLERIFNPLMSGIIASAFFLAIVLASKGKWMGLGDVKLAFLMGIFLGFPNIVVALFSAFLTGAIIGLGLVLSKKKTMKSEVPFGPFLVAGTFLALFFGQQVADWYFSLFY